MENLRAVLAGLVLDLLRAPGAGQEELKCIPASRDPFSGSALQPGRRRLRAELGTTLIGRWAPCRWAWTTVYYRWSDREVFLDLTNSNDDRDGDIHVIGLVQSVRPFDADLVMWVGLGREWQRTQGQGYDRNAVALSCGASYEAPCGLRAETDVPYLREDYRRLSSIASFSEVRDDGRTGSMLSYRSPPPGRLGSIPRSAFANQ